MTQTSRRLVCRGVMVATGNHGNTTFVRSVVRCALVIVVVLAVTACGSGESAGQLGMSPASSVPTRPRAGIYDAQLDLHVPGRTLADWTSNGDIVAVVTVLDEVPGDPDDPLGAAGWTQQQTLHVDRVLWRNRRSVTPPRELTLQGGMLVVAPPIEQPLKVYFASVDGQYLVALTGDATGQLVPIAPALPIISDPVDPASTGAYPFATALAGLDIAAVGAALRTASLNS